MNTHYMEIIRNYKTKDQSSHETRQNMLFFMERNHGDVLTRNNPIAHMTASSVILNESRDKMLMIHHKIYDTWTWQGGHADGEADLLAVALKEAEEETGIHEFEVLEDSEGIILNLDILTVKAHLKNGRYVSAHLHLNVAFLFEAKENSGLILNESETNGIRWIPLDDIERFANEPEITPIYLNLIKRGSISYK